MTPATAARTPTDLERQLGGWRLATAEITYRLPDHPALLQTFVWQHYDLAPAYPELRRFLAFWAEHIDGLLHSVRVGCSELLQAPSVSAAAGIWRLH
ncbi:MAG: Usg family protein [Geminicoccaceae bacterium]